MPRQIYPHRTTSHSWVPDIYLHWQEFAGLFFVILFLGFLPGCCNAFQVGKKNWMWCPELGSWNKHLLTIDIEVKTVVHFSQYTVALIPTMDYLGWSLPPEPNVEPALEIWRAWMHADFLGLFSEKSINHVWLVQLNRVWPATYTTMCEKVLRSAILQHASENCEMERSGADRDLVFERFICRGR